LEYWKLVAGYVAPPQIPQWNMTDAYGRLDALTPVRVEREFSIAPQRIFTQIIRCHILDDGAFSNGKAAPGFYRNGQNAERRMPEIYTVTGIFPRIAGKTIGPQLAAQREGQRERPQMRIQVCSGKSGARFDGFGNYSSR